MKRLLADSLLPYILVFLALPVLTLAFDLVLHRAGLLPVGLWFGPIGTALVLLSLMYSLRRRKLVAFGTVGGMLGLHEVLGWLGALLLLIHGGIHLNAVIPWLAELELLIVVASGMTGKVLLTRARRGLAHRRNELLAEGLTGSEVEQRLMAMALVTRAMSHWRSIHIPLTTVLAALVAVHVFVILLFR